MCNVASMKQYFKIVGEWLAMPIKNNRKTIKEQIVNYIGRKDFHGHGKPFPYNIKRFFQLPLITKELFFEGTFIPVLFPALSSLLFIVFLTSITIPANAESAVPHAIAQKVVYVFAHEDDEIDVVAKIVTDMRAGKEVHCVWVTNGGMGGPVDVRLKETKSVMALLNVPESNLVFLGYPDQGAYKHVEEIYSDLSKIIDELRPVEIMSHAYEGGNIDHDIVAFVSDYAARRCSATHLEFPDNNIYKGQTQIFKFLPGSSSPTLYTFMDKELFNLKIKIMHQYPSQSLGLNSYELAMDKHSMKKYGEPYRVAPAYNYSTPPAETLRYSATSKNTATFELFKNAAEEFMLKMR